MFTRNVDACRKYFYESNIDSSDNPEDVFDQLMSVDTRQANNCIWIMNQYKEGNFSLEDVPEARELIQKFYRNRGRLDPDDRDLMKHSYQELVLLLDNIGTRTKIPTSVPDEIASIDPTGQYIPWLMKQYRNREFRLEDASRVKQDIQMFMNNKRSLPVTERSLELYTYSDIKRLVDGWSNISLIPVRSESNPDIEILSNTGWGRLSIPVTEEASCILGKGTRWCTAATRSDNMFKKYNEEGPLYVWEDFKNGGKYQFHFESAQFMDARDDPISPDLLYEYRNRHPILKELFHQGEKRMLASAATADPGFVYDYMKDAMGIDRWPEYEEAIDSIPLSDNKESLDHMIKYAIGYLADRYPRLERFIGELPNPQYAAAMYIIDLVNISKRWKKGEDLVLKELNPDAVYYWNQYLEAKPFPKTRREAQDIFEKTQRLAQYGLSEDYAKSVSWDEGSEQGHKLRYFYDYYYRPLNRDKL